MSAYHSIPFAPFALALAVTAVPAVLLPPKTATLYVLAVLVGYAVYNTSGISALTQFVRGKVSQ